MKRKPQPQMRETPVGPAKLRELVFVQFEPVEADALIKVLGPMKPGDDALTTAYLKIEVARVRRAERLAMFDRFEALDDELHADPEAREVNAQRLALGLPRINFGHRGE